MLDPWPRRSSRRQRSSAGGTAPARSARAPKRTPSASRRASSTRCRPMPTRVLIVDDDPRFRALARALLQASGYIVAAEAGDAEQALAAARAVRPDAALVDVQL